MTRRAALGRKARAAAGGGDWPATRRYAAKLIAASPASAEGHFLAGLAASRMRDNDVAARELSRALSLDDRRYDAAVELAAVYRQRQQPARAFGLLECHASALGNSPRYLDQAAGVYIELGYSDKALPLLRRAVELQPEIVRFREHLAACLVDNGQLDEARGLYRELLDENPSHQRNHYQLTRLTKSGDTSHVDEMRRLLDRSGQPDSRNIFLFYAIATEYERLERWNEAFEFYERAGKAVASVARYDVAVDVDLIDTIIATCDQRWMSAATQEPDRAKLGAAPLFVIGLPRSGTTLTERILASHSRVDSVGETRYLEASVRREAGLTGPRPLNARGFVNACAGDVTEIAERYVDAVAYRTGNSEWFIDKYPENIFHAGFAARAFPDARFVLQERGAMDTCFALFKQPYFRYAFTLPDLASFYIAHWRLAEHWRALLGERLVSVRYEDMVGDQEGTTRSLLERLGLRFEPACLSFEVNPDASATASNIEIRERIHSRSVGRWRKVARHLEPLRERLAAAGIDV